MKEKKREQSLTEGGIFVPLVRFALPVLLALFLQAMYGAVDLFVVGKFGAAADVSAVSTGGQLMHTVTVVLTALAMGITVLVGRRIGEGRSEQAGQVIGSGLVLFAGIGVLLTALLILTAGTLAGMMHAPAEAFAGTVLYIRICGGGSLFIVLYNVLGSIFRGVGDANMPLITVSIACVCNIAGDYLFVGGLHMGVAGAALATVLAQAISVLLSWFIIRRRPLPFPLTRAALRPSRCLMGRILLLGAPIALQELLVSISFLVILAIVNALGLIASAGIGVAEKLCAFIMLVPSAYMQSMSAFVAQNMGAGKPFRASCALRYSILTSFCAGLMIGWLSFFHGDLLAGIFSGELPVIAAAADYLRAYAIDCLLTAFLFCLIGFFNGCGQTLFVMVQGIVGAFFVRIPISWCISRMAGASLFHIGLATPASTVVQIALCGIFLLRMRRKGLLQPEGADSAGRRIT